MRFPSLLGGFAKPLPSAKDNAKHGVPPFPRFGREPYAPQPSPITSLPTPTVPDTFIRQVRPLGQPSFNTLTAPPSVVGITPTLPAQPPVFVNRLKSYLRDGKAVVFAFNIRTFGARDLNGDGVITPSLGESGTFLSVIPKLDALKAFGFNTIHLLPISPVGRTNRLGEAGSVYAPSDYHHLNPEFGTPNNGLSIEDEARLFVQEAHKRGLHVMVDVPSCASEDLARAHPELIAVDADGNRLTPGNWIDIVAFENNEALVNYFEPYFDLMANKIGVDGFRCDVARYRSDDFWRHFISKYPEKGWFAESYITEDDSPIPNIPRDRPIQLMKDGFDTYYGQFHIFHQWNAGQYMNYVVDTKKKLLAIGEPRAFMGTFYTHDDPSLMKHGGLAMYHLSSAMAALQPFTSPYIMDGYLSADPVEYNIFDYRPPSMGQHPEAGLFLKAMLDLRKRLADQVEEGSFTPLPVHNEDPVNQVIAFTRSNHGRSLLVLANKDISGRQKATITVPGLSPRAILKDEIPHDRRFPNTGQSSLIQAAPAQLQVDLEPGAIHAFVVDNLTVETELPTFYNRPEERHFPGDIEDRQALQKALQRPNFGEQGTES